MAKYRMLVALALSIALTGCAASMSSWLVNLRNSQGDSALERGSLTEAGKEYQLALALAPSDTHARAGLAQVLYQQARINFVKSKLDEAEAEVAQALKYVPYDPNTQALASEVEQAKLRRDVVLSNYPSYQSMGASISASMKSLTGTNKDILKQLAAFSYDYDPAHLSKAIEESYALQDEMSRITSRLVTYRSLVQAGAPKAQPAITTETPNLLPIP